MTIGQRVRPLDWERRTLGVERYTADLASSPHLYARILRSPYPHASIQHIDTSAAEALPGVHAVLTAADFPAGVRYIHRGEPWSERPPLADGVVRFIGQEVAAVAAATPAAADAAIRAIAVRYRRRRAPLTVDAALRAGAPKLHERPGRPGNVADRWTGQWGDVAAGRLRATRHVTGQYIYPSVTHACMEPNTTLAVWHEDLQQMELWTSTQAPYFIVKEVAHVLGLRPEQVVCREIAVGGSFGSKSKISEHEALAAALARKARQPVLLALSREEEFAATKPRHAFRTVVGLHADESGILQVVESDILVDNGAYTHMGPSVMRAGVLMVGSTYRPAGVSFDARLVDTATQPGGQFRGYGGPQVVFALESEMDELAAELGLDPIDLRLRNANVPDSTSLSGARFTSVRLRECLESARDAIEWDAKRQDRRPGRGLGVAVAMHGSGAYSFQDSNRSDAAVDVFSSGTVRVRFGGADAGTGQRTILAQIAAAELGVDVATVEVLSTDSENTPFDMGAWSSRGTHMTGMAVAQTARSAATRIRELARQKLDASDVVLRNGMAIADSGQVSIGDLVLLAPEAEEGILTTETSYVATSVEMFDGSSDTANLFPTYSFTAHAAEVHVDERTGRIQVTDYVAATDCGRALNPTLVEGQIIGGVAMGLGAALGEEIIREGGRVVNPAYINYALPRAADLPRIRPLIVEGDEPEGPHGAKSVGELPVIPVAAAVANAVSDALGVRLRELPLTPDKVLSAIARRDGRSRSFKLWRRPDRWYIAALRWLYPRGLHHVLHRFGTRFGTPLPPAEIVDLTQPTRLNEAAAHVREGARLIGGGTDLLLQRRQGLAAPVRLASTTEVSELRGVGIQSDGWLHLGAAATLAEVADAVADVVPALAATIETIASPQVRGVATVAGNLLQAKRCWFFRNDFPCYKRNGATSPCYAITGDHRFYHAAMDAHRCQAVTPSDLATTLVALDAVVAVFDGEQTRTIRVEDLYSGPGESVLAQADIVTSVRIPPESVAKSVAFEKLGLWEGDFAVASVALAAAVHSDGTWHGVRLVLGAIAPTPWRARTVERALEGSVVTPARLRHLLDQELNATAHPLPGNVWKLDAASGLAVTAAERLAGA